MSVVVNYRAERAYSSTDCSGSPPLIIKPLTVGAGTTCAPAACVASSSIVVGNSDVFDCITDVPGYLSKYFGSSTPYIQFTAYFEPTCGQAGTAYFHPLSVCLPVHGASWGSERWDLAQGSASTLVHSQFSDAQCSQDQTFVTSLTAGQCSPNGQEGLKLTLFNSGQSSTTPSSTSSALLNNYTNSTSSSSSSSSIGAVVGGVVGGLAVVAIVVGLCFVYLRRSRSSNTNGSMQQQMQSTQPQHAYAAPDMDTRGGSASTFLPSPYNLEGSTSTPTSGSNPDMFSFPPVSATKVLKLYDASPTSHLDILAAPPAYGEDGGSSLVDLADTVLTTAYSDSGIKKKPLAELWTVDQVCEWLSEKGVEASVVQKARGNSKDFSPFHAGLTMRNRESNKRQGFVAASTSGFGRFGYHYAWAAHYTRE
ncbi:hypothetical protein BC830DRAFT_362693 [Chytriomyces sp. MP71]|nr:hypothetical protein BC830DRAFT_362693 [Chytriomyces sp. MP71]